ncbi:hypothetical protein Q9233_001173 [Columba guinea]|nr:hypothetical protein Q9233_001173 [Columba guinea]
MVTSKKAKITCFSELRVNDGDIAFKNGIKMESFSNASEILDITGTTGRKLENLRAVTEIPTQFRSIFKEFPYFNYAQSKALDDVSMKLAPIKALCSQRFDDWKEKFGPIGLSCKELTGDTVMDDLFEIHHADIIITTPEKWDSMTRRWRDNSIVQLVRLFLIDEIAEWLSDSKTPAVCLKIDEDQRPVKLRKIVLGFPCSDNQTEFKFDLTLNYKIASIIQTYSEQKPALVFCATRKGVQQAASVLAKDAKFLLSIEQKQRLQMSANSLKDAKLRVTTSTLAMGVNLPAHLVVIKSTMHYVGGVFQEYSETDILQMIGRAGRPQVFHLAWIKLELKQNYKITMISNCTEFLDVKLRTNEKKILNTLNKDKDKITIR